MKRSIFGHIVLAILSLSAAKTVAQLEDADTLRQVVIHGSYVQESEIYHRDSIPLETLEKTHSLVDALRASSAIYIKEYGPGNIASLVMRGGGSQHTSLYWNGMPINSPSLGLADISLLPTNFIDEVVVHEGSSSLLSGAGGLSGSVHLNSQLSKQRSLRLTQDIIPSLGSFRTSLVWKDYSKKWRTRTAASSSTAENKFDYIDDSGRDPVERVRENAEQNSKGLSQDIAYEISPNSKIGLHTNYLVLERNIPSIIGVPSSGDVQNDEVIRVALTYKYIGNRIAHHIGLGYSNEYQEFASKLYRLHSELSTSRIHGRYQVSLECSEGFILRARLDIQQDGAKLEGKTHDLVNAGVFLEGEKKIASRVLLNSGLRFQWIDGVMKPYSASAGVRGNIRAIDGLSVSATGTKNFRAPTLNDLYWPKLGNEELLPENGYSIDAGLHYTKNQIDLSSMVFANWMSDLISWNPSSDGQFRPINVSESKAVGFSQSLHYRFGELAIIELDYTYTDAQEKKKVEGEFRKSIYQPGHVFHSRLKRNMGLSEIACSYNFTSEVKTDYSSSSLSEDLRSIHMIDLHFFKRSKLNKQRLRYGFTLKNILDKNYEYVKDRPIPGRYIQVQLILNFNDKV